MKLSNSSTGEITAVPVIAVDGPSGSGKGTISSMLARALNWHFLDSGAVYRVLAFAALQKEMDLTQEKALSDLAQRLVISFQAGNSGDTDNMGNTVGMANMGDTGSTGNVGNGDTAAVNESKRVKSKRVNGGSGVERVICEGQNVTEQIRSEACGNAASKIAVFPSVREALLMRQRAFRKPPGLVADGRDMGTVVFQDAFLKIFLEATPAERAKRRFLQLKDTMHNVTLQSLLTEIEERDRRDTQRAVAPLKPAKDAVVIDTTGLGIEVVFDKVMAEVKQRLYKQ